MSSQRGSGVAAGRRGSSVGMANAQLLERIVDQLEQNPLSITTKNSQVHVHRNVQGATCLDIHVHVHPPDTFF